MIWITLIIISGYICYKIGYETGRTAEAGIKFDKEDYLENQ